jgi:hypothetical protein
MKIKVKRGRSHVGATLGSMWLNDVFECFTLEDEVREIVGQAVATWKIENETAIPAAIYNVTVDKSTRFKRYMPHILNVPGFTGIRIHVLNTAAETEGCIGVGKIMGRNLILKSQVAFDAFFEKLAKPSGAKDADGTVIYELREPTTIEVITMVDPKPEDRVWPNG